jgi:HAMP domain-containing protein
VLCWLVCGRALKPLRRITALAGRLSQDTLGERIAYAGPRDELQTLADSFDAMLDRLTRAFESQRLFVANASHELRAPLTVIRTAADLTLSEPARPESDYRRSMTTVEAAAQRSQRLLDSLLRLARTQHRGGALEPVDLAAATRAALGDHLPGQPRLHTDLDTAHTMADPVLIELLLRNLLDNATRYNQPDGWIRVRTTVCNHTATLDVENTGPLITPGQAAHHAHHHPPPHRRPADHRHPPRTPPEPPAGTRRATGHRCRVRRDNGTSPPGRPPPDGDLHRRALPTAAGETSDSQRKAIGPVSGRRLEFRFPRCFGVRNSSCPVLVSHQAHPLS